MVYAKRLHSGANYLLVIVLCVSLHFAVFETLADSESSRGEEPAEVSLAPLFTDNVVLQRDVVQPIWGSAPPGVSVTIRFAGQTATAVADSDGLWRTNLASLKSSSVGRQLEVESVAGQFILDNVVVGDVWLCSGQSNMQWPLKLDPRAKELLSESDLPLIRHFKVGQNSCDEPSSTAEGTWVLCAPTTAGDFTAVGYYFARQLQPKLEVPVGIINASWGGTKIESWMSREALKKFPEVAENWNRVLESLPSKQKTYEKKLAEYRSKAAEAEANGTEFNWRKYPKPPPGPATKYVPSGLFNGMIAPLVPYPITGVLWYQGEGNCGNADSYRRMFPAHIKDLCRQWDAEQMPFYFVQLPNYDWTADRTGVKWAKFRSAQMDALEIPNVGAAIVIDGLTPSEGHPPDKGYIGARLARLAEVQYYGVSQGDASGPICQSAKWANGKVTLHFEEATSGLNCRGEQLIGFEVAGPNENFSPAKAQIVGDRVLVDANVVSEPAFVRYAWSNNPAATLYNGDGLPASPFVISVESNSTAKF